MCKCNNKFDVENVSYLAQIKIWFEVNPEVHASPLPPAPAGGGSASHETLRMSVFTSGAWRSLTRKKTSPSATRRCCFSVQNAVTESFSQREAGGSGGGDIWSCGKDDIWVQRGDLPLERLRNRSSAAAAEASQVRSEWNVLVDLKWCTSAFFLT